MGSPRDTACYRGWEEVSVAGEKGRREVRYYLKRRDGGSDLAVVGKEKSLRHMSYYYALKSNRFLSSKLKSRRDVIDWLNSIVSDEFSDQLFQSASHHLTPEDGGLLDAETFKAAKFWKVGQYSKDFSWIGAPTFMKRRKHYASFCRNGVKISIHDFVYVLAEDNKRLVAYLEDMYEDARDSKMVVVRWFHKLDEVGIVLPHNVNDREIFFSLCLQDINVECIDGLATVLSPLHYQKFLKEATHVQLNAFVCQKVFDNDVVKPFDITQVKGYWKQELLRYMYRVPFVKPDSFSQKAALDQKAELTTEDHCSRVRPKKKYSLSKNGVSLYYTVPVEVLGTPCVDKKSSDLKCGPDSLNLVVSAADLSKKKTKQSTSYLKVGLEVEVLSEDSGIRGCWFRALIIKKHKDKLKVQYQELLDADDEAKKLEEWISASRVASPDQLGIRISGRTTIRPAPDSSQGNTRCTVDVGTLVDVWWHDGWWEGIVVQKKSEDGFQVYLPEEKRLSIFQHGDVRHSKEWSGNVWTPMKCRPELVSSVVSCTEMKQDGGSNPAQTLIHEGCVSIKDAVRLNGSQPGPCTNKAASSQPVPNLLKDVTLCQLKWNTSRKRKRTTVCSMHKLRRANNIQSTPVAITSSNAERSMAHASFNVDRENCKNIGDSLFSSSVVPALTSLVMSR